MTKIFVSALILLQKIHAIGIVHGDIHRGNIAFGKGYSSDEKLNEELKRLASTPISIVPELVLIDFGKATFDSLGISVQTKSPPNFNNKKSLTFLSPDQLSSEPPRPRDDVYRLFELFIDMITDDNVTKLLLKAVAPNLGPEQKDENKRNATILTSLMWIKTKFNFIDGGVPTREQDPVVEKLPADLIDSLRKYSALVVVIQFRLQLFLISLKFKNSRDPKILQLMYLYNTQMEYLEN